MPVEFKAADRSDGRTCVSWCRSKSKLLAALPFIGDAKEWVDSPLLKTIEPEDIKKYPLGDVIGVLPNHEQYGHMVRLEDYDNGFYIGTQLTNEGVLPFRYIGDDIVVLTPIKGGKKTDDTKPTKEAKEQELLEKPKEVDEQTIQEVVDTPTDEAGEVARKTHADDKGLGKTVKSAKPKSTKRRTAKK